MIKVLEITKASIRIQSVNFKYDSFGEGVI